jgi:hypothetical protein
VFQGRVQSATFKMVYSSPWPRGMAEEEAMGQHIVTFEFVRETSFFELFSVFELLCMAGWLTVL